MAHGISWLLVGHLNKDVDVVFPCFAASFRETRSQILHIPIVVVSLPLFGAKSNSKLGLMGTQAWQSIKKNTRMMLIPNFLTTLCVLCSSTIFLHIYAILGIFWDDDWWLFYFFIGLEHQPEDIPQFQHHYLIIKWWRQGQRQVQQQEGGVPRLLKGQFAAHCAWVALVPIDY